MGHSPIGLGILVVVQSKRVGYIDVVVVLNALVDNPSHRNLGKGLGILVINDSENDLPPVTSD